MHILVSVSDDHTLFSILKAICTLLSFNLVPGSYYLCQGWLFDGNSVTRRKLCMNIQKLLEGCRRWDNKQSIRYQLKQIRICKFLPF